jgi:DNA-binding beta-propeller fold protein YncE
MIGTHDKLPGLGGDTAMLRTTVVMLALAGATLAADEGKERAIKFNKDDLGKVPAGWKAAKTGKGEGSVWKIVADDSAPSGNGYVLAQTAEGPNSLFNICVLENSNYKNVELSVSFKPIAGKLDQGGGFVWRYKDNNNYYLARLNPAGKASSFVVYKVEKGKRSPFQGKRLPKIPVGKWHTLKVTMAGDRIECYFDGKKELEVTDSTFTKSGRVGLWSKSDARTHFDGFRISTAKRGPLERVATIPLKGKAGALDHLAIDSKNSRLFVANQSNDTLDVVDLKNNKLLKQVSGQKEIHGIAYAADLDRIFVGNGEGVCNAIDGKDYRVLKSIPVRGADSVRYDPGKQHVFVAGAKALVVIDAKALKRVTAIKLPASPHGFQVASKLPRAFVNTGPPCVVAVADTDKNDIVASYPFEKDKRIGPLALDETGGRIFVGLRGKPRLAVLDLETGKEVASVLIPDGSDDMFFDAKNKRIYVSCNTGFVAVVQQADRDHYESVANVKTIKGAKTSAFDPTTRRLYVAVPRQAGKDGPEIWVYRPRP